MKKSFRKVFVLTIICLIAIFMLASISLPLSFANASVYSGDYICLYYDVNSFTKKVCWKLEFSLNSVGRALQGEEQNKYVENIQSMARNILEERKAEYQAIYDSNPIEKYNPNNTITHSIGAIYDKEADNVHISFYFNDLEVYQFYNSKESDKFATEKNIFADKQTKSIVNPFAEIVNDGQKDVFLAQYYYDKFISACAGLSIENTIKTNYNPTFIYDYATSSNKVKSNSIVQYSDSVGKLHHAWGYTLNNIGPSEIFTLSLVTVSKGFWYLIGISCPLVVMAIAIVIAVIVDKNRKSKKVVKIPEKDIVDENKNI